MIYVLDASVILKWFIEEPESPQALTYRSRLLEGAISVSCPDLILYEVGNVLRCKRGVPEQALNHAISDLLQLDIEIFAPTEGLLRRAGHISYRKDVSLYDAIYIALAQEIHATLVSADFRLCHQADGLVSLEPLIAAR